MELTTTSPFSHVAMCFREDELIESKEGHGVRLVPLDTYPEARWFRVRCDQKTRDAALQFALSKLGQSYGYREAFRTGERDWLHITARKALGAHLDCSGLVFAAYRYAGLIVTRRPLPAPCDIAWSPLVDPI